MACAVTDFPEPDSPTTQTISPAPPKRRVLTALTRSAPLGRRTVQALDVEHGGGHVRTRAPLTTMRVFITPARELRIEPVAQAVAEHIERRER